MATVDGVCDASCEIDVVVLEKNHVEKSDTMVHAAANLHSLLLEHAHTRSGLTSVEDVSVGALETLHVLVGHSGDATHALHDVEHKALCLKERAHLTANHHGDVALTNVCSVADEHFHLHLRVEACEYTLCHFHSGKDAVLLDEEMRLAHGCLGNAT